jgi:hypothetical protein
MLMKLDTLAKLLVTTLMLLGALAASRTASAAPEGPQSGNPCYANLSEGQKFVVDTQNEWARLGVQGFSPLRNFPVPEVKWSCWSAR